MEQSKTVETAQAENVLLFLLTDNPEHIEFIPRKRGRKKVELVSCQANCPAPKRKKTRSHPVNPYMDVEREKRAMKAENYRTHSNHITDHAMMHGCRVMKNEHEGEPPVRELPYHRPMDHSVRNNVGPQPMRN